MKQLLILICLLIIAIVVKGQTVPKEYPNWINTADSLYKEGDYKLLTTSNSATDYPLLRP